MAPLEDGAAQTFRGAVMTLASWVLTILTQNVQRKQLVARKRPLFRSSARSAPMCLLLDPCSDFDVAMVPAAMARQDRHKRRRGLGRVPLTRRSTSGLTAQFGQHLWLTSSTTQVPVSPSAVVNLRCMDRQRLLPCAWRQELGLWLRVRAVGFEQRRGSGKAPPKLAISTN